MPHKKILHDMIQEVSHAPLKPQQKVEIVRNYLIPKLKYSLTLGEAHCNTLKAMDQQVRQAIRGWLRLPKDTSIGFIHSTVKDGGLGIPCLLTIIRVEKGKRLERLLAKETPWMMASLDVGGLI
eukprot:g15637.t1